MVDAFRLQGSVSVDTTPAERGLQSLGKQVADFGSSVKEGLGIGAGIAAFQTGLAVLERGFGALKGSAIDFNQTIDGARATMGRFFTDTNSLNASIAYLNDLAAKTPFAFEGMLKVQQLTIGAARSGQELKDNMDAIAVAAANTGRVGSANVERIGLALGQMQAKGHLAGGELLQLTEAGVNMGEILAKHFGVSTAEIQKMVSAGKIGSQDVFAALRENAADPRNREALETLAKTWEGALSTIGDVGKKTIADTFRPLFDLMTEGAVAVADFLQSADFKAWAEAVRIGFTAVADGVKGLIAFFGPLGEAISTAFHQLTEGDFAGAFATLSAGFQKQIDLIGEQVAAFIDGMYTGGSNAIISFADGMISGGMAAIKAAIDGITTFIADMLIGNSPPKSGPLSQLDKGGENAAKAWTDPFGQTMLKETGTAVEGAKQVISGLRDASRDVAGQIRDITEQSQDLDRTMKGIRETISNLKDAFAENTRSVKEAADATKQHYADAIQSVRDQIDTIKDQHDKAVEGIQSKIDSIKDRYGAAIDAVKGKIDQIKESYDAQETAVQRQIDQIKDKYGAALDGVRDKIAKIKDAETDRLTPLQRQLQLIQDANKYQREQQDIQRSLTNAKIQQLQLDALGDPKLRAQLGGQLAGLDVQQQQVEVAQQILDTQQKLAATDLTPLERKSLEIKLQQLQIQQKLADMVDTTKLSEATQQQQLAEAQQKQLDVTRAIEDANQKTLALPIEKKITEIQRAADAALVPLNQQLRDIERDQKTALDPIQDKLRALKASEVDALTPLQAQLKQLERDQKAALDPLQDAIKNIKREEQDALRPLEQRVKDLTQEGKNADRVFDAMLSAIAAQSRATIKPLEDQLTVYQHQKDALADQRQELERIKAQIAETIAIQQEAARAAKNAPGSVVPGAPAGGISFEPDAAAKEAAEKWKKAGATLAENMGTGFAKWWEDNKGTVIERVIGAIAGGLIGGPIGAVAGAAFLPQFIDSLNKKLKERGFDIQPFIDQLNEAAKTGNYGPVAFTIASGISFSLTRLPWVIAKEVWRELFTPNDEAKSEIGDGIVKGLVDGVKRMLVADAKDLLDLGMAVKDAFVQVGTNVIDGLRAGIQDAGDKTWLFIKQVCAILIGIFETAFGIASPSTVMHEIGVNLIQGLLDGLTDRWEALKRWWTDLPKNIQTAFGWTGNAFTWVNDLNAIGSKMLENIWDGLNTYWTQFSQWWSDLPKNIQTAFGWTGGALTWVQDLQTIGIAILTGMRDGIQSFWNDTMSPWLQGAGSWITGAVESYGGGTLKWLVKSGSDALQGMKDGIQGFWDSTARPWLEGAGDWITKAFTTYAGGPINWLMDAGSKVLEGLKNGLFTWLQGDEESTLAKWIRQNLTDRLPEWVKHALGVNSPSTVFKSIGQSLIDGLLQGMQDRFPAISDFISMLTGSLGNVGGDVTGWLQQAIQLTGVGANWLGPLQKLVGLESGGDPHAVNKTDVYGVLNGPGPHAKGLLQVIDPTFQSERDRNLPNDIFNPVANAVASIHHILHAWGSPWEIPGLMDGGRFGGYKDGGIAWGPQTAHLAEVEPEVIIPRSWFARQDGSSFQNDQSASPVQTHEVIMRDPSGRVLANWWIKGRDIAIETRRAPLGVS